VEVGAGLETLAETVAARRVEGNLVAAWGVEVEAVTPEGLEVVADLHTMAQSPEGSGFSSRQSPQGGDARNRLPRGMKLSACN